MSWIRSKAPKASFVLNGVIFLLGADLFFERSKYIYATVSLLAGLVNFYLALRYASIQRRAELLSNLMNFLVALSITWDYFASHKHYIQYAWLFVTVMYALLTVRAWASARRYPT